MKKTNTINNYSMKSNKILISALSLMIALFVLAGCGNSANNETAVDEPSSKTVSSSDAAEKNSNNDTDDRSQYAAFETQAKIELAQMKNEWESLKEDADQFSSEVSAEIEAALARAATRIDQLVVSSGDKWLDIKSNVQADFDELKTYLSISN